MGGWTEYAIYQRICKVFPAPAHVMLSQVRNGTGFARSRTRTADALAVSTYPSRGLWFAGIEIKTYLGDWRRELADPDKASEFSKYCRYWYVAAPAGMVPKEQLPDTWGLIECTEKSAKIEVKAPANDDATKPDMLLVCSILRTFTESYVPKSEVTEAAKVKAEEMTKATSSKFDLLKEQVDTFETASGIRLADVWCHGDIGKAVKLIVDSGIMYRGSRLEALRDEAERVLEACNSILAKGLAS